MAKLNTAARKSLPTNDFAVPNKAPGSGSYPIQDKNHAQNALARSSGKLVAGQVKAAVAKKYPTMAKKKKKAPIIGAKGFMAAKMKSSMPPLA